MLFSCFLHETDFSHNKLGGRTGRALGKLLKTPSCPLETLILVNNEISKEGGEAIGHALKSNSALLHLNFRMNRSVYMTCIYLTVVHTYKHLRYA